VRKIVSSYVLKVGLSERAKLDDDAFEGSFERHRPDTNAYEFDQLSFNQYQQIFVSHECWASYADELDLPVKRVDALLTIARNLRNQIMHNRGLPSPAERDKLIYCRDLLNRVADRRNQPTNAVADEVRQATASASPPLASEPEPPANAAEHEDADDNLELGPLVALSGQFRAVPKQQDRVTWTFADLDVVTQRNLPRAASEHRSWWTNDEQAPQSAIWRDAGWRVVSVNMTAGTVTFGRNTEREERCLAIFGKLYRRLFESPDWSLAPPTLAGRTWQSLGNINAQDGGASLRLAFTKNDRFQVTLYIDSGEHEANKASYDNLARERETLEALVGAPLTWERLPHRRASKVSLDYPREVSIRSSDDAIEDLAEWAAQTVPRFAAAMAKHYLTVVGP